MRRRLPLLLPALLAACQQPADQAPAANQAAATRPAPAPTPSRAAAPSLARYAGHYPTDRVGTGAGFLAEPLVRAAVEGVVDDPAVRARVLDREVTATPIAEVDGRLLAYGCEPHNCGPHNWAIAVAPDGSRGAVCYFDEERGVARWYPAGAAPEPGGGCPSGPE